jgi:hypothetical protein
MADCSQHLVQIMESQTRFDLNAAVQKWLQELAAQPNLTLEARRELEAHVRDTVTELQGRGLNDEESFWLARRRAGQPSELNQEFGKADPAKACREGVLWIAVVFFALYLWQECWQDFTILLRWALYPSSIARLWVPQVISSLTYLPVAWLAVSVARGRASKKVKAWRSLIRSRSRVLIVACFLLLGIKIFTIAMAVATRPAGATVVWTWGNPVWSILLIGLSNLAWPALLIAVIVWLLPAEESRTYNRALRE